MTNLKLAEIGIDCLVHGLHYPSVVSPRRMTKLHWNHHEVTRELSFYPFDVEGSDGDRKAKIAAITLVLS
jgi:hypothetical protein